MMKTKCCWVSFFGLLCGTSGGLPALKDVDLVDTLDTEIAKITKKLAESRKAATAQLTLLRSKKAVP